MFSKRTIKTIYKLRYGEKTFSSREIASIVKKRYGIKESKKIIYNYIVKNFPSDSTVTYSEYQKCLLARIYTNFSNKEKLISYFNKKFHTSLTCNKLRSLMSSMKIRTHKKYAERRVSLKDKKEIARRYSEGETTIQLAKEFGYKTPKSINDILRDINEELRSPGQIRQESVPYKDLSFEKIDTKVKAYFLGLLLTDGYNSNSEFIGLQLVDKDCIDFLHENLKLSCTKIKKKNPNCLPMYRLTMYGKERIEQLERLGIIPKKSLILKGPSFDKIDDKMLPYVIRGIIDGDGWIRKDGREFFICSASQKFIEWCREALERVGIQKMNLRFTPNDFHGIYTIRSAAKQNINILKNVIYDVPFGMTRKFNRIHKIALD